jgi:hypothetical protein
VNLRGPIPQGRRGMSRGGVVGGYMDNTSALSGAFYPFDSNIRASCGENRRRGVEAQGEGREGAKEGLYSWLGLGHRPGPLGLSLGVPIDGVGPKPSLGRGGRAR